MWRLKVSDEEFSEKQQQLSRAVRINSSNSAPEEWVVVNEAKVEKQLADAISEPSTQASGTDESMGTDESTDSDESMDSHSEDAYPENAQ
jgi:sarcosine oxidase gamma subunit